MFFAQQVLKGKSEHFGHKKSPADETGLWALLPELSAQILIQEEGVMSEWDYAWTQPELANYWGSRRDRNKKTLRVGGFL